ncbi:TPA: colicin-like pore-forming protein [Escherichia coli]
MTLSFFITVIPDHDKPQPPGCLLESLAAGRAASAVTAWTFSVMLGTPVGILGFAIIMAAVSALVNDKFIEQVNKLIGI